MSVERRRVLLVSHDTLGAKMAGPGIRYYHLANVLSRHFDLTLAVPRQPEQLHEPAPMEARPGSATLHPYVRFDWETIQDAVHWAEVIIFPSDTAVEFPLLTTFNVPLVVDGYDPLLVEWLALHAESEAKTDSGHWRHRMHQLYPQYSVGDFYICASERQRDWWLGMLEAYGRVNPWTFADDPSLRRLIDIVPYGLPEKSLTATRSVLRDLWPQIGADDKIIVWGGGLWLWLDPLTAIRAVAQIWTQRQDVRLIFPGTRHPNPVLSEIGSHNQAAKSLAAELDLLDKAVFFGDWVPYDDWANLLLECDVALSLHFDTAETRLAFRSRVLEYIWAGLPCVVSTGDATSDLVAQHNLGTVVGYEDVDSVASAILAELARDDATISASFAQARQALNWEVVARPLIEFCRNPYFAADRSAHPHRVGHPVWLDWHDAHTAEINELRSRIATLEAQAVEQQDLIRGYEQGRFMRLMHWLKTRI
ncbi:MAG: glycosyltransferase family 4 protein [Caldilineaceae bacterium]|nr:glycosyltransferase family 4 protein [Caldilineaceae bacterium]